MKKPEASFFLQRGFGENIDFGPFLQFFADDTPLIMLQPTKNSGNLFSVLKRTKPCYISELLNTILNDAYSTGELKKIGSANLYYTRQSGGEDVGRLPCALLGQSV